MFGIGWQRGWVMLTGLLALTAAGTAHAQGNAFLPQRGHGTLALSHTFEAYDEFWRGDEEVANPGVGRVETGTLSVWMQAGLTDDLAVVANVAYVDVRTDGSMGFQDQGLGDRSFLLRYRFLDTTTGGGWRHSLVAGAGVRLPAGGYEPNGPVALGDGTNDGLFRLVYQTQLNHFWGSYLAVEGGWDAREEDAPDNVSLHGELGATFSRLTLSGSFGGTWADGGSDIGEMGFTFPGLDEDLVRLGGNAYYRVSPAFGVGLSAFTILDGRNTGVSDGVSTSFVLNL